jgi:hypothetical protein
MRPSRFFPSGQPLENNGEFKQKIEHALKLAIDFT